MIETQVSKGIISTYFDKLERNLNLVQSDCHSGRGYAHHQGLRHQL